MKKFSIVLFFLANLLSLSAFAADAPRMSVHFSSDTSAIDSVRVTDFVGKYSFEGLPFDFVEVSIREVGKIHIEAGERVGDVPPMKDKPDAFETPEAILTFVRDDKNNVVKLLINTGDATYEGSKVVKK